MRDGEGKALTTQHTPGKSNDGEMIRRSDIDALIKALKENGETSLMELMRMKGAQVLINKGCEMKMKLKKEISLRYNLKEEKKEKY
ncbi:hypothetical protein IGI04_042528 [Brassica rapa subsp. trilocularis]|uniref:Uncharacterized protein n=1 Tax=Brassica rapa subsp. trilocularis TaxID=1813537 RepID=A0ABQ7KJ68_BRACM|nr:hypothetical protein IGI04_042528 [Brassica rapa subsp. trilocularis]